MHEEKKKIRKELLHKRNEIDPVTKIIAARDILSRLAKMDEFQKAEDILLYASYDSEVPTREIFDTTLWMEKRVFFPKVTESEMEFYEIKNYEELSEGYKGILEPDGGSLKYQDDNHKGTFMILPGSVFGRDGYRIGYGKGYYDRYLTMHPSIIKCGICYSMQLISHCPHEAFDIKMDIIVTERETIHIERNRLQRVKI